MVDKQDFGTYGVWLAERSIDDAVAQATERLGYGALWVGGSPSAELTTVERILDVTEKITVATGIVNIWKDGAAEVAASVRRIEERHPGRFVLGIGSGHREATPHRVRPLAAMREYLDVLEAEGLRQDQLLLAALGDKTLTLAAERTIGAHPYLTLPEHTAHARPILGDALLAPELKVVVGTDREEALGIARRYLGRYFGMENYVNALVHFGADREDIETGGSDALIDRVSPGPTVAAALAVAQEHLAAGADHVSLQPLGKDIVGSLEQLADGAGLRV